jgi:hypothetical protein
MCKSHAVTVLRYPKKNNWCQMVPRRIVSAIRLAAPFHFGASWPTWAPAVRDSQFDDIGGLMANSLLIAEEPAHFRQRVISVSRQNRIDGRYAPAGSL